MPLKAPPPSISQPVMFIDRNVRLIIKSIEVVAKPHKVGKLELVLREWEKNDLTEHFSLPSAAINAERRKHLEDVSKKASALLTSLESLDAFSKLAIAMKMARKPNQQYWAAQRADIDKSSQRIAKERDFLKSLSDVAPMALGKAKRGHPRNRIADLVLKDAAAIFEWLTETEPKRKVDREGEHTEDGYEYGPFWNFSAALWPLIFEKGEYGLQAGIKRWAELATFKSPLIYNISMRHPLWRLFAKD